MLRGLTPLVISLLLTGCQVLPRAVPAVSDGTPAEQAFTQRQEAFASVDDWELRGRSAVSAGDKGWSGSVHWDQSGPRLDLRFIAPLGAGTLRITGSPELVHIQGSDGTDLMSTDPEADLVDWFGVEIPLRALRWWVMGIPVPGWEKGPVELDAAGRAVVLQQDGWRVSYPRYTERSGMVIPGIVVAERGTTRVRLVVDRWERR